MNVTILENRCLFTGFRFDNQSRVKQGIRVYENRILKFKLLGILLNVLGYAVTIKINNQFYYLNKKSLYKWIKVHEGLGIGNVED